jgi:hypothetical protein
VWQTAPDAARVTSESRCGVAKLMTRFGKRVGALAALHIEYPVGRDGARFQALLATAALAPHDTAQLRFFVVQDDAGKRYPAMIEHAAPCADDAALTAISGVVVAGW